MDAARSNVEGWQSHFSPASTTDTSTGPKFVTPANEFVDITGLIRMARTSNSQLAAIFTVANTIVGGPLVWATGGQNVPMSSIEVSVFYRHAQRLVENIMIMGFAVWRIKRGLIEVAEPGDFLIRHNGRQWVPVHTLRTVQMRGSRDWRVSIYDEPARRLDLVGSSGIGSVASNVVRSCDIRSACSRSYLDAVRQQAMERQFLSRDRFNAMPAVFTSVSGELGNAGGNMRTWFRDVNMDTSSRLASAGPPQRYSDFSKLVKNRADTIQKLSEISDQERQKMEMDQPDMIESGVGLESHHREFVLTDGKTMADTKTLLSCADSAFQYNRARHSVMALMGVPAQAIGESVNTERNSANSRQFETAMLVYSGTVQRVRTVFNEIFQFMGKDDGRHPLSLPLHSPHTLETLTPMLKSSAIVQLFSETYEIDRNHFDLQRVTAYQDELIDTSKPRAPAPVKVTGNKESKVAQKERQAAKKERPTV